MKKIIFTTLILCFTSAFGQSGNFKGYVRIEAVFKNHIFKFGPTFGLIDLMGFTETPYDFINVLGTSSGGAGSPNGGLPNSTPNAFNLVIWQILFDNSAKLIASQCSSAVRISPGLQPEVELFLDSICQWPLPVARDEQLYRDLFDSISSYEIPQREFRAWYEHFVLSGDYDGVSRDVFVHDLFYTLFLNPHFLLKK